MTENQKLREALQAVSHIDDSTNHAADASEALDRIGQIARQALALPTAAPVGEREAFEHEMSNPPFDLCMDRWPDDGAYDWPGNYAAYHTQCAWMAWQARAALSAGDAVNAQRTPLTDEQIVEALKACEKEDRTKEGWIWRTRIKWARAIEQAHGIDAAMRKGQG